MAKEDNKRVEGADGGCWLRALLRSLPSFPAADDITSSADRSRNRGELFQSSGSTWSTDRFCFFKKRREKQKQYGGTVSFFFWAGGLCVSSAAASLRSQLSAMAERRLATGRHLIAARVGSISIGAILVWRRRPPTPPLALQGRVLRPGRPFVPDASRL